jgi:hypothetical protein
MIIIMGNLCENPNKSGKIIGKIVTYKLHL